MRLIKHLWSLNKTYQTCTKKLHGLITFSNQVGKSEVFFFYNGLH